MRESGMTRPGIEPGSPLWEAGRLTAQPLRPQQNNWSLKRSIQRCQRLVKRTPNTHAITDHQQVRTTFSNKRLVICLLAGIIANKEPLAARSGPRPSPRGSCSQSANGYVHVKRTFTPVLLCVFAYAIRRKFHNVWKLISTDVRNPRRHFRTGCRLQNTCDFVLRLSSGCSLCGHALGGFRPTGDHLQKTGPQSRPKPSQKKKMVRVACKVTRCGGLCKDAAVSLDQISGAQESPHLPRPRQETALGAARHPPPGATWIYLLHAVYRPSQNCRTRLLVPGTRPENRRHNTCLCRTKCSNVSMEQCPNARAGEMGDPRGNLPTSGVVRHDSYMSKSGSEPGAPQVRVVLKPVQGFPE
ncbi:hypothetical protein PR048_024396 [Dryococelus australis]|uniref:Uncharacterized protein n=1 Tax=Dryococelus australis TaxID=614101 RepID=A0ABQ9GNI8_9NEOP|nr:hypothetical protein PR048_024396 [Dryococelus australis]